ncbi:Glycine-rich RNA-binding protein [Quillaja saponaria]|uniref:Glycine-rich RNA-binding protein n=1 Tax=Quillaja saponaria TaxID=32244 RepID=A0AAD7KZ22_QUISA|nr:Glycine-rich RNA-binding protein [Quillaja saponaria]
MAMRAAVAAAPRGLRRLFSTTPTSGSTLFTPQANGAVSAREQAEPSTNLFVSGLSKRTTTEGLREAFSKFGEVVHARVVTDRVTGFSKAFGFVRYATIEEAAKGIEGMDGKFLDGWVIFAEYARPRPPLGQQENMAPPYGRQVIPYILRNLHFVSASKLQLWMINIIHESMVFYGCKSLMLYCCCGGSLIILVIGQKHWWIFFACFKKSCANVHLVLNISNSFC